MPCSRLAAWTAPSALDAQDPAPRAQAPTASPFDGLRRGRDGFVGARDFSAALGPAESIVDAQREQREPQYPADLAALGLIQAELREIDDALDDLVEAIGIVEDAEGEYSPTLIEYYRGLGRTYIKSAQYQQAIVTLEQAQHISQRHLGLFNVEQAALLDDITTAYLGLGNTTDAQKSQVERLDNAIRRFGAADPRVIPFRYTLAKYYEQSRLPESAREQYRRGVEGARDAARRTRRRAPGAAARARRARSARRARRGSRAARPPCRACSSRTRTLHPSSAGSRWRCSATGPPSPATRPRPATTTSKPGARCITNPEVDVAAYFRKPTMIDFVPPLSSVDRNERSRPYTWAEIVLEFDVSAEGLPSDVRVVTRDPQTTALQSRYTVGCAKRIFARASSTASPSRRRTCARRITCVATSTRARKKRQEE